MIIDNDLSLLGRGLAKRKRFISLGPLDMALAKLCTSKNDRFFPLKGEASRRELFNCLSINYFGKFPSIAPDFVLELRSETNNIKELRSKMQEYMDPGVLLEWLINPQDQEIEIYRRGQDVEVQNLPTKLFGENVLLGFPLSLSRYF